MYKDLLQVKGTIVRRILIEHFSKRETSWDMDSMEIVLESETGEKYYLRDVEISLEFKRKVNFRFES